MEVKSVHKYARISAKKARDVAREIQDKPVSQAIDILAYTPKKAAFLFGKVLKAAVANAEANHSISADDLIISSALADEGPTFKRSMPRARGSANPIRKRTAHLTVVLSDLGETQAVPAKKKKDSALKAKPAPSEEESKA